MNEARSLAHSLLHDHMTSDALVHSIACTVLAYGLHRHTHTHTHQALTLLTVISSTSCSFFHTQQSPALR